MTVKRLSLSSSSHSDSFAHLFPFGLSKSKVYGLDRYMFVLSGHTQYKCKYSRCFASSTLYTTIWIDRYLTAHFRRFHMNRYLLWYIEKTLITSSTKNDNSQMSPGRIQSCCEDMQSSSFYFCHYWNSHSFFFKILKVRQLWQHQFELEKCCFCQWKWIAGFFVLNLTQ